MSLENAALIYKGNLITGGGSSQVSTMPVYSSVPVGTIVQYVGATTQDYTNGFFYKATANGWENVPVQDTDEVSANTAVQASDATLTSLELNDVKYKVNSCAIYDVMPSKADLIAMPNGTYFKTLGFYSKNDGAGGLYLLDGAWRRGTLILQTSPRKVLHALNFNGAEDYNEVPLVRYGVRPYMVNADVPWDTITPENTYASANSDIIDALYGVANYGANLVLPAGRFFFERPMLLNREGAQVGLKGDGSVWRPANYRLSAYIAGTTLYFPFLTNGQDAVRCVLANVENVSIIGSPLTYNMSIDRTKTITAPDEVVTETVKVVDGTEVKCVGLHQTGCKVQNVMVAQFWQGFYGEASNIYINNIFALRCHFGINLGNDIKCIGVYGWDVHTCVRIRGSITSLTTTRVDSCVHALEITGGASLTVTDLDGDYCTESLILVKSDNWQEISHSVFTGIHGRCCTLKSYDSTQSSGVDIRTLQDTSGYGIIRVEGSANFRHNRLVINTIGNANPFDNNTNYRTPTVLITNDNYGRWIDNNIFEINESSVDENFLLKNIQAKSNTVNVTCRVDTQLNSFTFNGDGTIRRFAKIDDTTPASNTVYSSEKIEELLADATTEYPDYAKTEMESVLDTVKGYISTLDNPIIIGFNTDQHINPDSSTLYDIGILNEVTYGLKTLRDLTKKLPFNFVVLGGDTNGGGSNIASMQNSAIYISSVMDGTNCPLMAMTGNHEGGQDDETITRGQVLKSHMTNSMQSKIITLVDKISGYFDDPICKVRYVFLDAFPRSSVNYTTSDVNTVLAGMLSTIPSGYKAIIFSHHPLDENLPQVADRKGWNNPTACHATLQTYKDSIIACFCGHIHNNLYVEDLDGVTFVATTCAGWYELNDGSTRTAGTAGATAYDVFVIDQTAKKIYAVRYGNGNDREISYEHTTPPTPRGNILSNVSWTDGKRINSSSQLVDATGYSVTDIIDDVNAGDVLYFADGTLPVLTADWTCYSDDGTTTTTIPGISGETYGATYNSAWMYFMYLNSSSTSIGSSFWQRVLEAKNPSDQYHSTSATFFGETTFWASGFVKSVKLAYNGQSYQELRKIRFTFPTAKKGSLDIRVNEPIE